MESRINIIKREIQAVILAAGKSSRMAINGTKLLLNFEGKTIIHRVVDACKINEISKINVIVGFESDKIIKELGTEVNYIFQNNPIGTGDALKCFFDVNNDYTGDLLVLVADTPLLDKSFISKFIDHYYTTGSSTLLAVGIIENNIPPYARVLRSEYDDRISILEDFECSEKQKAITEVVTSQYCFRAEEIKKIVKSLGKKGENGNDYLNDIINKLIEAGKQIETYCVDDIKSVYGINNLDDLNFIMKRE